MFLSCFNIYNHYYLQKKQPEHVSCPSHGYTLGLQSLLSASQRSVQDLHLTILATSFTLPDEIFSNYIPGPEEPEQAPPSPDYVPGPEHADDEIVAEDQPYAEGSSPIAQSPEYVPDSNFEAHPKNDDDEDPEEDPVDYLADEEEEEEHPTPADSVVVAPTTTDQAPSAEETEPFETDESVATPAPHTAYHMTSRISIPAPVPMPAWTDSEVVRLLAISSPPASPLSPRFETHVKLKDLGLWHVIINDDFQPV
nr:hypothetical protein [Tanacetum cinerariifolium]